MISFLTESQNQGCGKLRASVPEDSSNSSELIVDFPARPRRRATKSVQFAESSILHQWVDERKSSQESWESKSDYKTFRRNLKHEVVIMRNHIMSGIDVAELDACDNNDFCIRGMEHLICPKTLQEIIVTREAHKTGVLEEQFRQSALGLSDHTALRSVSRKNSKWGKARAWAYSGGKKESRRGYCPCAA